MIKVRKHHSREFKSKVAIEAIKEHKTINELTTEYAIHSSQINNWKKQALAIIPTLPLTANNPALPLTNNTSLMNYTVSWGKPLQSETGLKKSPYCCIKPA